MQVQLGVSHSLEPHTLLQNRWLNSETATIPQYTFDTCKEHAFTYLDHLKTRTQAVNKINFSLCVPQIPHHQHYFSWYHCAEELQLPLKLSGLTPCPAWRQHPPASAKPVPPTKLMTLLKSVMGEKNRLVISNRNTQMAMKKGVWTKPTDIATQRGS